MDTRRRVVRDGYERIADQYLAARLEGRDVELLSELVRRVSPGARVLDAGCGAGVPISNGLVEADLEVVGLDLSRNQLSLARAMVPDASLVEADLSTLPFHDGSFEGLVSYYAVIHVPRSDHRVVFDEFARVLRPGGPRRTSRCCTSRDSRSYDTSSSPIR